MQLDQARRCVHRTVQWAGVARTRICLGKEGFSYLTFVPAQSHVRLTYTDGQISMTLNLAHPALVGREIYQGLHCRGTNWTPDAIFLPSRRLAQTQRSETTGPFLPRSSKRWEPNYFAAQATSSSVHWFPTPGLLDLVLCPLFFSSPAFQTPRAPPDSCHARPYEKKFLLGEVPHPLDGCDARLSGAGEHPTGVHPSPRRRQPSVRLLNSSRRRWPIQECVTSGTAVAGS